MAKARPITGLDAHAPTGRNARVIARIRLDELYDWSRYIDDVYHGRELHNLRIAAKRLRYTLEVFEAVLPAACLSIVKELEMVQEELGALHDSDVMITLLRLCLGGQDGNNVSDQTASHSGEKIELPPELVADVVEPAVAPITEERYGLEQLLLRCQRNHEEQFNAFQEHWRQLQVRNFRHEVLGILEA